MDGWVVFSPKDGALFWARCETTRREKSTAMKEEEEEKSGEEGSDDDDDDERLRETRGALPDKYRLSRLSLLIASYITSELCDPLADSLQPCTVLSATNSAAFKSRQALKAPSLTVTLSLATVLTRYDAPACSSLSQHRTACTRRVQSASSSSTTSSEHLTSSV